MLGPYNPAGRSQYQNGIADTALKFRVGFRTNGNLFSAVSSKDLAFTWITREILEAPITPITAALKLPLRTFRRNNLFF